MGPCQGGVGRAAGGETMTITYLATDIDHGNGILSYVSVAGCDMLRTFGLGEADLQPCIDRWI